jgi:hypothetical protein
MTSLLSFPKIKNNNERKKQEKENEPKKPRGKIYR